MAKHAEIKNQEIAIAPHTSYPTRTIGKAKNGQIVAQLEEAPLCRETRLDKSILNVSQLIALVPCMDKWRSLRHWLSNERD